MAMNMMLPKTNMTTMIKVTPSTTETITKTLNSSGNSGILQAALQSEHAQPFSSPGGFEIKIIIAYLNEIIIVNKR